jgi:hypothetical protein
MTRFFLTLLATTTLIVGTGNYADSAESSCEQQLNAKCTACHYNNRICLNLSTKSKRAWKRTVKNMIHHGAKITPEELNTIVTCLSGPSPDVTAWCKK